jgi:hypothetical protein
MPACRRGISFGLPCLGVFRNRFVTLSVATVVPIYPFFSIAYDLRSDMALDSIGYNLVSRAGVLKLRLRV